MAEGTGWTLLDLQGEELLASLNISKGPSVIVVPPGGGVLRSSGVEGLRSVEETRPLRPTVEVGAGYAIGFDRLDHGDTITLGIFEDGLGRFVAFDRFGKEVAEVDYEHGEQLRVEDGWQAVHISGFALSID